MTFGTARDALGRVAFAPMTAILTIACELALPGVLWMLWREAARADQEVQTMMTAGSRIDSRGAIVMLATARAKTQPSARSQPPA
jgi:hypothetical protein